MHRTIITAAVLAFSLTAAAAPAFAMPCKDMHGRFVKCPPPMPVRVVRCKDIHGKFMKCGMPGAHPY